MLDVWRLATKMHTKHRTYRVRRPAQAQSRQDLLVPISILSCLRDRRHGRGNSDEGGTEGEGGH